MFSKMAGGGKRRKTHEKAPEIQMEKTDSFIRNLSNFTG